MNTGSVKAVMTRRVGLGAATLGAAIFCAPLPPAAVGAVAGHSSGRAPTPAVMAPATPATGTGTGTADACGEPVLKADGQAWTCTFADDFSGSSLDGEKWIAQRTATSNFSTGEPGGPRACYLDDPSTISVAGGNLRLSAVSTRRAFRCGVGGKQFRTRYAAGMVSTHGRFAQTYGRFEVRARIPDWSDPGLQETLWLWPVDPTKYGAHPGSGEIDFAEFYSVHSDRVIPRLHYSYDPATVNRLTNTNVVTNQCLIDPAAFNTYTLEWEPGRLTIMVNGTTCLVDNYVADNTTDAWAPFNQPFMVVLTQALGHGVNALPKGTDLSETTYVDHVRVWR
ncbi:glycoside hydrolase family 16 protein [Nocardioides sp. JQ2195]|uniref:glycoside hydrolase family 16 protein n=1 Tax=Nocardioides sp. JQ2195 TaxID=2592334 RepID=UPI00143EACBF|nr:glycoside hydrolase family 16 protein [Nocardioides sp. JQ2195]QIX27912.1 glycoside hydrolase family 16 protein [Nocardioides sp. JQ2195]